MLPLLLLLLPATTLVPGEPLSSSSLSTARSLPVPLGDVARNATEALRHHAWRGGAQQQPTASASITATVNDVLSTTPQLWCCCRRRRSANDVGHQAADGHHRRGRLPTRKARGDSASRDDGNSGREGESCLGIFDADTPSETAHCSSGLG